ncbi:hypothetical protein V5799_033991 [Amblyomma americanum]|uniref:Uncharacterized protein n=1 Tax=Amblyomma americanum TaxID=6943 RepID=A0AAQ4DLR4_AMBAM
MPPSVEHVDKWDAVFDLILFRQLKEDVDDTLVQKLVSFLDASVQNNADFGTQLWKACSILPKLEKAVAVPRTSESLCFALHLIAAFGKLEPLFVSLRDDSRVLKALNRLINNANASERAAYLGAVISFLRHRSGRSWCVENGVSSKLLQCLQDASVFVQGKAEAFFVAFLESDLNESDGSQVTAFLNRTLTEEMPPRQRKKCLHIVRSLLGKDLELSSRLCSDFDLHRRLLDSCVTWLSSSTDVATAAADVLAKLLASVDDESLFHEALSSLSGSKLVCIKFAASFIQESAPSHPSKELEEKIAEIITGPIPIVASEPESGDKSKERALQSAAICELKRAVPHFLHSASHEMVADKVAQFLLYSPAAKVTRILSVALECFASIIRKMDLAQTDPVKLKNYLDTLAPFLRDANVSAHALKQALTISVTLSCAAFSTASENFDWRACGALCFFGESLQRHLVSTEPQFVEAALDAFSGIKDDVEGLKFGKGSPGLACLVDWLQHYGLARFVWDNLRNNDAVSRLTEEEVIRDVTSMAVEDVDVFARRSAASTLCVWLDQDYLGLRSKQPNALRDSASKMLSQDLDAEVQLAGLSLWKAILTESLNTMSIHTDASVRDVLREADRAGFGTSVKKAMAADADEQVRVAASAFLHHLSVKLHNQFSFSAVPSETGCGDSKVCAMSHEGNPAQHTEAAASMDCSDATVDTDREAAMEEVLDLAVSECLQRKLKLPEDVQKATVPITVGNSTTSTADILATLSSLSASKDCDMEHGSCDFQTCASLIEDLLAAAASEHCDRDCY